MDTSWLPPKAFFTLREACDLKGLNYKSACNRIFLQPNQGIPDTTVGGRKVFSRETLLSWIFSGDEDLRKSVEVVAAVHSEG